MSGHNYLRPVPRAHWLLPAAIVGFALLLVLAQSCRDGPRYAELAWILLSASFVVWANHLNESPIHSGLQLRRIVVGSLRDALLLLVWIIVASIPIVIFTPTYQCYTQRAKVSQVVLAASAVKGQVEENARAKGRLDEAGKGLRFQPSGRTVAGHVTKDGEVIAIGDDPPVVIVLSPMLVDGLVKWSCRGYPRTIVPLSCRGDG